MKKINFLSSTFLPPSFFLLSIHKIQKFSICNISHFYKIKYFFKNIKKKKLKIRQKYFYFSNKLKGF